MIYDEYGRTLTLVVGNEKGGVGKSTVTNLLAGGLAMRGYRILVCDTDTQGQAARLLGLTKRPDLYQLLTGRILPEDALRLVDPTRYAPPGWAGTGALLLLASDRQTQFIPLEVADVFVLRNAIETLGHLYQIDLCIVDTAPTATLLEAAVYYAADTVLLVTEATALAADGLAEGIQAIEAISTNRTADGLPLIHALGVLVNKLQGRPNVQKSYMTKLKAKEDRLPARLFDHCLPQRTIWQDAAARGQTIFSFAPTAGDTEEAGKLVDEVEMRLLTWLNATN